MSEAYDAIVVGAGFGGLGAALSLAEAGASVLLLEALNYPGGCASTFSRDGRRFEAGATLFSGFDEGQLMRAWIDRYALPVTIDWLDPLIELRTPSFHLPVPRERGALVDAFAAFEPARRPALERFFAEQRRLADTLWELFDDPELLPPLDARALARHAIRFPRYLPVVRWIGRSLADVVDAHDLGGFEPLRVYFDALCQITVQASMVEAEAPFALGATDYCFRGTGHVRGGIGQLATALCGAIEQLGGDVRLSARVKRIERDARGWVVEARGQRFRAPLVVGNLLPQSLAALADVSGGAARTLQQQAARVEEGWGAAMLYLSIEDTALEGPSAHHLELVADPSAPFVAGNHVFCSISDARETDRAPTGERTVTVSTHVPMRRLRRLDEAAQGAYVSDVQARMRRTLTQLAPEVADHVVLELTASPRTFERFTRRPFGYVGGVPRRVGLHNYQGMFPAPLEPGLFLVGDTAFPGQSTLATAIGGARVARAALVS